MFEFLRPLGSIGHLLPKYIEGRKMAEDANWRDLQNYETNRQQQLFNLYQEDIYPDAVMQSRLGTINARMNTDNAAMLYNMNLDAYPYARSANLYEAMMSPYRARDQARLDRLGASFTEQLYRNPNLLFGAMNNQMVMPQASLPSGI